MFFCEKSRKLPTGFTLIELLVVISIISLLSSVILSSLNSARAKANDARAKSDFNQVQKALTLYYDKYGTYPNASPVMTNMWVDNFNSMASQLVTEGFLSKVPTPPDSRTYNYYNYGGNVIGGLIVTTMSTIPATNTAPPPTCKPFNTGNWCDTSYVSNYYCICNPY